MDGDIQAETSPEPVTQALTVEGLMAFASHSGRGVAIWDRDLRLVSINALGLQMLDVSAEEIPTGMPYADVVGVLNDRARREDEAGFWPMLPISDFESAKALVAADPDNIGRIGTTQARHVQVQRMIVDDSYMLSILTDLSKLEPQHQDAMLQQVYLETTLQNMTDGAMMVDEVGRIIACNRRLFELYEVDPDLFVHGMPAREFMALNGDLARIGTWPERERVINARTLMLTGIIAPGETVKSERRLTSGTILEVTRTSLPRGASVITVRDATESAELARQRQMFKTVLENIDEGVTLIESSGVFQLVNARMLELYGIEPGQVSEGMHVESFARQCGDLDGLTPQEVEAEVQSRVAFATSRQPGTVSRTRELGNGRTLHVSRTSLDGGGAVATYRDVTREIERTRLLAEAKSSAEEASRLKSDFLARVTHELRTPMNGVLGMAALLDRTDLTERQRHFLEVLSRSGEHMVDLIDGLLTVATQESGGVFIEPEPVCLYELCRHCVDMVRPRAQERGLGLNLQADWDKPNIVMADETRLTQIIVNLLNNAVKFTEVGRVELNLSTQQEGDKIATRIEVSDTGVGIAEEKLDEIFQKFAQVGDSLKKQRDGVGLGLSIARSLAELMGGTLSARSQLGKGSVFVLEVEFSEVPPFQNTLSA
ncbi:MAG: PAS-domain containing protein [Pseudomonadota bacterium]